MEINLRIAGDNYPDEIRRKKLTVDNIGSLLSLQGRPILRHPDDMTEEEQATYIELWESDSNFIKCATDCLRYLHSIHIDTFGAIEAEFAIRKETK